MHKICTYKHPYFSSFIAFLLPNFPEFSVLYKNNFDNIFLGLKKCNFWPWTSKKKIYRIKSSKLDFPGLKI